MRIASVLCGVLLLVLGPGCNGRGSGETPGASAPLNDDRKNRDLTGADGRGVSPAEAAYARERARMVDELASPLHDAPITDRRVLEALRKVPRHVFVPESHRDQSYENSPLPIPENQTISQPYIVALMTQLLELDGTEKVLEIGTGSGYQAAILGELAAEVYTVEIRPALLEAAKRRLEELKEKGLLGYRKITCVVGDGSKGYPDGEPYDGIIVTAAPIRVPGALLEQLKPGGRLVIPVGDFFQELQLIRKLADGSITEESIVPVRFVPLVGGSRGTPGTAETPPPTQDAKKE